MQAVAANENGEAEASPNSTVRRVGKHCIVAYVVGAQPLYRVLTSETIADAALVGNDVFNNSNAGDAGITG